MSTSDPILSQDQVTLILDELKKLPDPSLYAAAVLAARAGLRMREAARLRLADISDTMKIGGRCARKVPLSSEIKTMIEQHHALAPESDLVFGHACQTIVANLNRALRRTCRKLQMPTITIRSLRLSFATNLVNTAGPWVASRVLGCSPRILAHL